MVFDKNAMHLAMKDTKDWVLDRIKAGAPMEELAKLEGQALFDAVAAFAITSRKSQSVIIPPFIQRKP